MPRGKFKNFWGLGPVGKGGRWRKPEKGRKGNTKKKKGGVHRAKKTTGGQKGASCAQWGKKQGKEVFQNPGGICFEQQDGVRKFAHGGEKAKTGVTMKLAGDWAKRFLGFCKHGYFARSRGITRHNS